MFFLSFTILFQIPATSASKITINIEEDFVTTKIHSSIFQNITSLQNIEITIDDSNNPELKNVLEGAISNDVNVDEASFTLKQSENWINLSGSFKISNVIEKEKNLLKINCSWRSFKISDELIFKNQSFNKVGINKLAPAIQIYNNSENVEFYSPFYTPITFPTAYNKLSNVSLLNFEELDKPLPEWDNNFNTSAMTTQWRMNQSQYLYLRVEVIEHNITKKYLVQNFIEAEITAPNYANTRGDMIIIDVSKGEDEFLMIGIVSALALIGFVGYFLERKIR